MLIPENFHKRAIVFVVVATVRQVADSTGSYEILDTKRGFWGKSPRVRTEETFQNRVLVSRIWGVGRGSARRMGVCRALVGYGIRTRWEATTQ